MQVAGSVQYWIMTLHEFDFTIDCKSDKVEIFQFNQEHYFRCHTIYRLDWFTYITYIYCNSFFKYVKNR